MKYLLYQVDAFTTRPYTGNPAGVVPHADGLDETQMQQIARELNNSETAFIFSQESSDYDVQVRFFTPSTEVPLCGHATIAAHYIRAVEMGLEPCTVIQKTGAGNLPVHIDREDGDYKITMVQAEVTIEAPFPEPVAARIVQAMRIRDDDLDKSGPIQIVSAGHGKVIMGLRSKKTLDGLKPDMGALTELSAEIGCNGYYAFTFDDPDPGILASGRMFAPAIGIAEDPVTGNANGPLGAYLVHNRLADHDGKSLIFRARQGEAMGRPGTVEVGVKIEKGKPVRTRVTGRAVTVFKTEIEI